MSEQRDPMADLAILKNRDCLVEFSEFAAQALEHWINRAVWAETQQEMDKTEAVALKACCNLLEENKFLRECCRLTLERQMEEAVERLIADLPNDKEIMTLDQLHSRIEELERKNEQLEKYIRDISENDGWAMGDLIDEARKYVDGQAMEGAKEIE